MPWNCEVPLQHGKLLTDGSGGVVEISPEAGRKGSCCRDASGFEHIWMRMLSLMSLYSWVRNGK